MNRTLVKGERIRQRIELFKYSLLQSLRNLFQLLNRWNKQKAPINLSSCYSMCGPQTSSMSMIWEMVANAESQIY